MQGPTKPFCVSCHLAKYFCNFQLADAAGFQLLPDARGAQRNLEENNAQQEAGHVTEKAANMKAHKPVTFPRGLKCFNYR